VVGATARHDYEGLHREVYATATPREVPVPSDVVVETHRRETYESPRRETYEAPRRETYEPPRREVIQEGLRRETYDAPRRETYEPPRRETYEAPRRETYQVPRREVVREAPRRALEVTHERDDGSWFWWALPLIGLALLGIYATKACTPVREPGAYTASLARRDARPAQPVTVPVEHRDTYVAPAVERRETVAPPTIVEPAVVPRLAIERLDDGRVRVTGVVADDSSRRAVLTAMETAFGSGKFDAEISVDPRAVAANWLGRLVDIAKLIAANPKAAITLEGNKVGLGRSITDADRRALIDSIKSYLGTNFTIE
jgi:hypothetical protein